VSERAVTVDRGRRLDLGDPCTRASAPVSGPAVLPPTGAGPAAQGQQREERQERQEQREQGERGERRGRPVLVVSRRAARARTVNRKRRLAVALRVDGTLRQVRVRMVDARGRTILSGRLRSVSRDRTLTLRRLRDRRARGGRHRVIATAVTRDGVAVRATRFVRLRR
jgi:hypothetical protein